MNLGEAKNRALMLIGAYSERGEVVSDTEGVRDYQLKLPAYFDMAQKNIAENAYVKRYFHISHIMPFTAQNWQLNTYTHATDDIVFSAGKAYAYSFKVDSDALVRIEAITEGGTTVIEEIYAYSNNGEFKQFKGLIEGDHERVQIRFSGDTVYNLKDIALYGVRYPHIDKIPNFGAYVGYSMPDDFYKALRADIKRGTNYEPLADAVWESPSEISVSVQEKGEIRIEYAAKVSDITAETPDSYEFEIPEAAQSAMVYYVAALLTQKEDYSQHQLLMQQYIEKMANIDNDTGLKRIQRKVKKVY